MTPILFFIGIPPAVAVSTEATPSGLKRQRPTAHFRRGNVDVKMGLFLVIGGLTGSFFGVQVFEF